jgi:hypothetical protein
MAPGSRFKKPAIGVSAGGESPGAKNEISKSFPRRECGRISAHIASGGFNRACRNSLQTLIFYVKISFLPTPVFVAFMQLLWQK